MDDDLIALMVAEAREHMDRAVDHTQAEFGSIRTGRATPALVEHLKVDYYGTETELRQMAGFSVPEARMLVVSPYDKGSLGAIEKALQGSDLGITPSNDGTVIRLSFPVPTEQRRKELAQWSTTARPGLRSGVKPAYLWGKFAGRYSLSY